MGKKAKNKVRALEKIVSFLVLPARVSASLLKAQLAQLVKWGAPPILVLAHVLLVNNARLNSDEAPAHFCK